MTKRAPLVTLDNDELSRVSTETLGHYERSAESFWHGTKEHDVSQNIAALLGHMRCDPPFAILDLGCGPGRDLFACANLVTTP